MKNVAFHFIPKIIYFAFGLLLIPCNQELSKFAQSGYTGAQQYVVSLRSFFAVYKIVCSTFDLIFCGQEMIWAFEVIIVTFVSNIHGSVAQSQELLMERINASKYLDKITQRMLVNFFTKYLFSKYVFANRIYVDVWKKIKMPNINWFSRRSIYNLGPKLIVKL